MIRFLPRFEDSTSVDPQGGIGEAMVSRLCSYTASLSSVRPIQPLAAPGFFSVMGGGAYAPANEGVDDPAAIVKFSRARYFRLF